MTLHFILQLLGIALPLIHLTGLAFAAHAALFTRTSQGAIAWALSLIFCPYVAVPLYLVFGRRKFHGYVEARRRGNRLIDHMADELATAMKPRRANLSPDAPEGRFAVLERLALLPFTRGNRGRLLIDGRATFDAIFAAIDAASHYLLVQFFIIRDDALGRQLQDRLIAAAARGVKVYFLYDEVGSILLSKRYTNRFRRHGVQAKAFNSRRGWWNHFQINFRNHRKIVVADGSVAFVGGHNVGTEYLGEILRFGHWRDTHVELAGPAVAAVQWSFIQDWHWATGEVLKLNIPPATPVSAVAKAPLATPSVDAITPPVATATPPVAQFSALVLPASQSEPIPESGALAIAIPSSPADERETCTLMFLSAISAAKRRFWITSPYFVPEEALIGALQLAALRGVDVRIMLPYKPDHLLVYLSSFSYLEIPEDVGVKFYRYHAGFLHQKVFLVDDDLAAIGTANLDNRSTRLNFELTILFADRDVAAAVADMLQNDFAQCERATRGDLKRPALPFRIAVQFARLLAPLQ